MADDRRGVSDGLGELDRFLTAQPDTRYIDAIFVDLCGIVRGKRYPRADVEKLFQSGLQIPYSLHLLDVTGESLDPCGRGFSDGDPDGWAMPLPGTLVPVPWAEEPCGQVLMTFVEDHKADPLIEARNVAARAVERFAETGLRPVIAFELEFYLLDPERDPEGRPQPPISPVTHQRDNAIQVYNMVGLDAFAKLFRDLEAAAAAQKLPASIATVEYGPGQYEINLRHGADPLIAADHCALFRHMVKRVALSHGLGCTFMSKPYPESAGSGMHVHMSLLDREGRNAFDDGSALGNEKLRHVVGGMAAGMAEAMAFFAPSVNAFRRFGPNLYVPVAKSWGADNRSLAFRVPSGPGDARRVEHRIAGADANPYLVLAAMLAGAQHGLTNKLDPGPPWEGNATAEIDPELPKGFATALDRMRRGEILRDAVGQGYIDLYCETKRRELDKFLRIVPRHEYDWYL